MGIHNRDYIRDEQPGGGFHGGGGGFGGGGFAGGFGGQWAIKYLLIANVAVFLLQNISPQVDRKMSEWGAVQMPVQVGASGAGFFPSVGDNIPLDHAAEKIPAGTAVEPFMTYPHEKNVYWGIRWKGQSGVVLATDMSFDFGRCYQLLWQLLTSGFLHGSFQHILFNMFVLWMFGRAVEPLLGSREFLLFYLAGVVVSGIGHILFSVITSNPTGAIGASGGVMAVVFLTAMTYPKMKVFVMFVIPMNLWMVAVLYAVIDVVAMGSVDTGVAHAAHLGGAAFGVAYKYYNWRLIPLWYSLLGRTSSWKRPRRNLNVRIFQPSEQPPDEPIDERVDVILDKIHQHGEASLTDEEREVLKEASRRLKRK